MRLYAFFPLLGMILLLIFMHEVQNQDSFAAVSLFGGFVEIGTLYKRVREDEIDCSV